MTTRQEAMLRFVEGYWREHGYGPTVRETCAGTGIASTSAVHYNVQRFVAQGRLDAAEYERTAALVPPKWRRYELMAWVAA